MANLKLIGKAPKSSKAPRFQLNLMKDPGVQNPINRLSNNNTNIQQRKQFPLRRNLIISNDFLEEQDRLMQIKEQFTNLAKRRNFKDSLRFQEMERRFDRI